MILDAALEYLDRGFSIIPVNRADKRPYTKWTEYTKRLPTVDEVERWWDIWPNANVAIITGSISGVWVVDADGPTGIEWMTANLPKTGVYSITAKGLHAIYRIPPGATIKNSVRLAPEVDVRGEGGYIVAPPSKHQSGHEYKWQMIMGGWDDLAEHAPTITRPIGVAQPPQPSKGNINIDLSKVSQAVDTEALASGVPEGERDVMLFREACRLRAKNITEQEAWIIIRELAGRCSPPFPEKEALQKLQQAWRYEPSIVEHVNTDLTPGCPIDTTCCDIPPEILKPGGMLQEISDYIRTNSPVSIPLFNLAAAITTIGSVAGQKVMTETGLRTNMYCITLGYSGSGKNAPFGTIPQLLLRTDANQILGPTELTSSVAILKHLSGDKNRACMMMLDEIGMVLTGLKRPDHAAADVPRILTKLFSGTDRPEMKTYASGDSIVVPWSHLAFYGASTPERFWESLTPGEVLDGFLARVMIFESRHDAKLPKAILAFNESPMLVEKINRLWGIKNELQPHSGNLERIPKPKIIPQTDDAKEFFQKHAIKYHNLKNQHKDNGVSSIYGRCAEHAAKLALIHAVSTDCDKVTRISIDSVKWAWATVDFVTDNTVSQVHSNIADNDTHRWKQKLVRYIQQVMISKTGSTKEPYLGATMRDIQRNCARGLCKRELETLIDSLLMAEEIGLDEFKATNGRQVKYYFIPK